MQKLSFVALMMATAAVAGCDAVKQTVSGDSKALTDAQIAKLIPKRVKNTKSWAADISAIYDDLNYEQMPDRHFLYNNNGYYLGIFSAIF